MEMMEVSRMEGQMGVSLAAGRMEGQMGVSLEVGRMEDQMEDQMEGRLVLCFQALPLRQSPSPVQQLPQEHAVVLLP
tara:strand:+ start:151 stop:381 length:231 start_codon:yes stop_codon:yes gene_type:complete